MSYRTQALVANEENGGGRSLEDMCTLKSDSALSTLLKLGILPSTDAAGDWLRCAGGG